MAAGNNRPRRGKGSIIKRGSRYSIIVNLQDSSGNRERKWESGFTTKRQAEKRLGELLTQIETGLNVEASHTAFGQFLNEWLERYVSKRVRGSTMDGYRQRAKHIVDGIGDVSIVDLRPDHLIEYYDSKLSNLSASTITKHHHLIVDCLSDAVKWNLVTRNVGIAVEPPRAPKREMKALSVGETHQFLDNCTTEPWRTIFHTLIWTGIRRSELLGLQWNDLDLDMALMTIRRSLVRLQNGTYVTEEPKTSSGTRTLDLAPSTCLMLKEHRANHEQAIDLLGIPFSEANLVFGHPDGTPRTPSTVTQQFRRIASRAGLPGVRLHDLRHTHASLMLQQGTDIKTISTRLGHSSVAFTMDTYAHLLPGMQKAAMEKFEEAFAVTGQNS
jgi:integrase